METRANYIMVGSFVLLLAFGLVGFVIWLAKFQFDVQFDRYDILYEGSVTGLRVGSPVRYRGVRAGEVIEVRLNPARPDLVAITIEVEAATPVRANTEATLEMEGLTGGLYVLLSGTTTDAPELEAGPEGPNPVIASRPSSLMQVLEGAPELLQKVDLLLARASDLLSDDNRAEISAMVSNLRAFTDGLAVHGSEFGGMIGDAGATLENLRGASEIGIVEDHPGHGRQGEVGGSEPALTQVRAVQIGPGEVRRGGVDLAEIGAVQMRAGQIAMFEVSPAEVRLAEDGVA